MSALDDYLDRKVQKSAMLWEDARAELAALRTRCERAEAEVNAIREMVSPPEGQSLIDAIGYLLHDDSSAEIYRIDLATVTAECVTKTDRITGLEAYAASLEEKLKMYQRREALRK